MNCQRIDVGSPFSPTLQGSPLRDRAGEGRRREAGLRAGRGGQGARGNPVLRRPQAALALGDDEGGGPRPLDRVQGQEQRALQRRGRVLQKEEASHK